MTFKDMETIKEDAVILKYSLTSAVCLRFSPWKYLYF